MSEDFIVSTGRIIKEYLEEYQISQKDLSIRTGISQKHISNVMKGNSRLTEDFALKLEKIIPNVSASYWLNYETKYREYLARELEKTNLANLNDLDNIAKKFRFSEVFHGLDISQVEQALEMLKLLKISNFYCFNEAYSGLEIEFMEDGGEKEAIAVWLNLCEAEIEIQNNDISNTDYNQKQLLESLEKFKKIAYNSNIDVSINSCRKLCNKMGIYIVTHEAITNSKVRGALATYKNHPAIYLSGRFKSHDNVWFALMHEIAHLILHYNKRDTLITFEKSDYSDNHKENEANKFARDFFINPQDYDKFILNSVLTKDSILEFARKQYVLPGIVVARLEHDKLLEYGKFSNLK